MPAFGGALHTPARMITNSHPRRGNHRLSAKESLVATVTTIAQPRWGNYQQSRRYSGLSTRLLQDYVKDNLVRSSLVLKPGSRRGVRLIDLNSLDALIEAGVGRKTELEMNSNRGGTPSA